MKGILLIVAVTFAAGMVAGKFVFRDAVAATAACQNTLHTVNPVSSIPDEYLAPMAPGEISTPAKPRFSCDGRQHCSQMTSKEEAQFFLKHCPNTKMDGDHDGDPCELDF